VSLRVESLNVRCETKTKDNVFVEIQVSVQFQIKPDRIVDAYYKLSDPVTQIKAYVYDVIRSEVPTKDLDDLFLVKEELANAIRRELQDSMDKYGFQIIATPVTDIDPDQMVKRAMNEINTNQRLKQAAADKGEAAKILSIKNAEALAEKIRIEAAADADAKAAAGEGLSRQRLAIIRGLQESINAFQDGVDNTDTRQIMDMIIMTQYFDTMKDIGANSNQNTLFIPHSVGALSDFATQLRQGILEAGAAKGQ